MIFGIFTVFDRVAYEAGPPFVAINAGVARRHYRAILDTIPSVDKDAYRLYRLGSYDSEKMVILVEGSPEWLESDVPIAERLIGE